MSNKSDNEDLLSVTPLTMTIEEAKAYLQSHERNSPCFCASGKKFKKCHLQELQSIIHKNIADNMIPSELKDYREEIKKNEGSISELSLQEHEKEINKLPLVLQKKISRAIMYFQNGDIENGKRALVYLKKRAPEDLKIINLIEMLLKFNELNALKTPDGTHIKDEKENQYSLDELKKTIQIAVQKGIITEEKAKELSLVAEENFSLHKNTEEDKLEKEKKEEKKGPFLKKIWGRFKKQ